MPVRLLVADSAAENDAAQAVEAQVLLQAFGNTQVVIEQEYGPYADRSRFITVIDDRDGIALGVARMIVPDDTRELKTLTDVARKPWGLSVADSLATAGLAGRPIVDVATLAVDPRYRQGAAGAEVTLALLHGLYRWSRDLGAEGLVAVLDDHVLAHLQAMGVPMTAMPGASSEYYLGSPASTPCLCLIPAIPESVRTRRPDLAPALLDGIFHSITLEPGDLHPNRGMPMPVSVSSDAPDQPSFARGARPVWRRSTYRRSGLIGPAISVGSGATD